MGEEIVDGGFFDKAAGIHHIYTATNIGDDAEVVGDENDGGAFGLLQFFQQLQDLRLNGDIQGGGGFVSDEERGFASEGHGDHDALAHAAGELMRVVVESAGGCGKADALEHFDGVALGLSMRVAEMEAGDFGELLADGEKRIERGHRVLKDHGDAVAADVGELALRKRKQIAAFENGMAADNLSRGLRNEAENCQAGDAFAGTAFADDAERFAGLNIQRNAVDGADDAVVGVKFDAEVVDFEQSHGGE